MASSTPKQTLASIVSARITETGVPMEEVLNALEIEQPAMLTSMLSGNVRFRVRSLPTLATALRLDVGHLLGIALREYAPATLEDVDTMAVALLTEGNRILPDSYRSIEMEGPGYSEVTIRAKLRPER